MKTATLNIQGMSCSSCVARVEKKLKAVSGVLKVIVNLPLETATIEFDEKKANEDKLIKSVEEAGYEASFKKKN